MGTSQITLIRELEEKVISFIGEAKNLKNLEGEVLNRKPGVDSWSVLECIEHMNRYSEFYLKEFKRAIAKAGPAKKFRQGWLGKKSADSMLPKNGSVANKMKTFKSKNPALDHHVDQAAVQRFIEDQEEMLTVLEKAKKVNINTRVKTTLPLLKFKLGDALAFYVNHEQRHMVQVEKTLSAGEHS